MARVLVVDDEDAVVQVVRNVLDEMGHAVTVANDGCEALDLMSHGLRPDLVILDVLMRHVGGLQVCHSMRTNPLLSGVPVLFLTGRGDVEDRIVGLEAGADDYLPKPFDLRELELRVEALLRYAARLRPAATLTIGEVEADPDSGQVWVAGEPVALTPIECELLYHLMSHAGEVLSSERLLHELWGYPEGDGNTSLVRMHVLNLRRKLERDPRRPTYVRTVPRHGYVFQA